MSTGVFLSIAESFTPETVALARALGDAVNERLAALGLSRVHDPETGPHVCEGRVSVDAVGSHTVRRLGELAGESQRHAALLGVNPYRLVFVPREFDEPQPTTYSETMGGQRITIMMGSSHRLLGDLLGLSAPLQIPLSDGALADGTAELLDDMQPLHPGENDVDLIERLRVAWLLLHEAALLSVARDVPLSLAG